MLETATVEQLKDGIKWLESEIKKTQKEIDEYKTYPQDTWQYARSLSNQKHINDLKNNISDAQKRIDKLNAPASEIKGGKSRKHRKSSKKTMKKLKRKHRK